MIWRERTRGEQVSRGRDKTMAELKRRKREAIFRECVLAGEDAVFGVRIEKGRFEKGRQRPYEPY